MLARASAFLRHPRIAVWLIAGLAVYAVVVTSRAPSTLSFLHPVFLLGVAWLTLSTAACAWDRTRLAWRAIVRPDAWRRSLESRALRSQEHPPHPADLDRIAEDLGDLGLRVERDGEILFARSRRWAHVGSPLFHWALVVLLAAAAAGQLTRAEGELYVPVGSSLVDQRASYVLGISQAPLFRDRFTGLTIAVEKVEPDYSAGGVSRGATPLVVISKGETTIARTYVYPNSPARAGSLLVHRGDVGPALRARFAFPGGAAQDVTMAFPLDAVTRRPQPVGLDLTSGGATFTASAVPSEGGRVTIVMAGASSKALAPGDSATLPGGISVAVLERTTYAELVVANDWSVPLLYAAFALAALGSAIALLFPPRAVLAVRESDGTLRSTVVASAIDPLFRARATATLRAEPPVHAEES